MSFSQKKYPNEAVLLVDNGSLRPEAVRGLRRIAKRLSDAAGQNVLPVSVLHSHKIDPERLDGVPAEIFCGAIERLLAEGVQRFVVLPLFFGPSRALTEYLPERFAELTEPYPEAKLVMASPLGGENVDEPELRLIEALVDRISEVATKNDLIDPAVIIVDHGSPVRAVTTLRDRIGKCMRDSKEFSDRRVAVASMERRPEPEYDFNEPLLVNLLGTPGFDSGPVIVAQLFLLEGRHAGPGGDIAGMCEKAEGEYEALSCYRTELLGEHPLIQSILLERFIDLRS